MVVHITEAEGIFTSHFFSYIIKGNNVENISLHYIREKKTEKKIDNTT